MRNSPSFSFCRLFIFILVVLASEVSVVASPVAFRLLLAPQALHSGEATLVWDKQDGVGTSYEILRDSALIASTAKTPLMAMKS